MTAAPRVLFAGGGTGGHVYPAVAVAEAMQSIADVEPVFCGTSRGIEARVVPARGWELEVIEVEPMKGGGPLRALRGAVVAALATRRAIAIVRRLQPRVVLSVGGYAAGPVTLAAALLRVPVAVMEPNRVVGLTNRILAPFAARAYVAWQETANRFRPTARRVLGVPLRAGFSPSAYAAGASRRILVLGGSQGAQALNDRMPEAAARLQGVAGLEILHQAGRGRDEAVRAAYARAGVAHATVVPFVDDVAGEIARADVVVARAGASTLAEITAIGRPALLVPFPHAADDHQGRNAEALAAEGGAVCLRQEHAAPTRLAETIERLLLDGVARVAMADRSRARGRPRAAHDVASDLVDLARIPPRARKATNGSSRHLHGHGPGHEVH